MSTEKDVESGRIARIPHFRRVYDQAAVNDDIINAHYDGSGTDEDPYIVAWLDDDPVNPMNYSTSLKWTITMLVAIATLAVAFVSSAYSGGIREIIVEFGAVQIIATLGISLFVLGFAIGPLMWAPMSGEWHCLLWHPLKQVLTPCRTVRTSIPLLRHLHAAHRLQRRCRWCRQHGYPDCSAFPRWCFWLLASYQRWRCHCRHVPCRPAWSGYQSVRNCTFPGSCHWSHW